MVLIENIAVFLTLLSILIAMGAIMKTTKKPKVKNACMAVMGCVVLLCLTGLIFMRVSRTHGATNEALDNMTWGQIITHTINSHKESEITDLNNLSDCYIIYYKFTCPDCAGTYRELQSWLRENPPDTDLYYIAYDSETGAILREDFPVETVPSMIYIYPNGRTFLAKQIYTTEADGSALLLPDGLDKVYQARKDVMQP